MNIKELPESLIQASKNVVETQEVLDSCTTCGAVSGSCPHTDCLKDAASSIKEDSLADVNKPDMDEPEEELSGEVEDVVINPEYKTFTPRRP